MYGVLISYSDGFNTYNKEVLYCFTTFEEAKEYSNLRNEQIDEYLESLTEEELDKVKYTDFYSPIKLINITHMDNKD